MHSTLEDTISEIHNQTFFAQDDNFFVQVTSGQIEKDYALDGQKNELADFVSIKVVAKQSYNVVYADFSLQNAKYSQPLEMSPIDDMT